MKKSKVEKNRLTINTIKPAVFVLIAENVSFVLCSLINDYLCYNVFLPRKKTHSNKLTELSPIKTK